MPDLAWMAWTWQTGLFFVGIASLLLIMTLLAVYRPETERVGVLRIPTTRGDRLFIGLLTAAFINLAFVAISEKTIAWFGLEQEPSVWISFVVSMAWLALVMRHG